jgi:hypothetical protein
LLAIKAAGITDCAEGVRVTLSKGSKKVNEAVTDSYGDFKFDNLEENSGRYSLEITYEGYEKKTIEVDLTTSKNVGMILL